MTIQNPIAGNDTSYPSGAMDRLALFAEWTGTTPPARILDDERAFTDEFLAYASENGLSLDWVWLADERGLSWQTTCKQGRGHEQLQRR